MDLTNRSYVISIGTKSKSFAERYYRDRTGWVKVSARGRKFRATAEQVLNHVLPALAGVKPGLTISVEHRELDQRAIGGKHTVPVETDRPGSPPVIRAPLSA